MTRRSRSSTTFTLAQKEQTRASDAWSQVEATSERVGAVAVDRPRSGWRGEWDVDK